MQSSVAQLLDALPQTQCTRCGYPDCAGYASAIATGGADINQCPPGGAEGIARLARLTGHLPSALNPANGQETPRSLAFIDEDWCIGCTLCIDACPTDAIVGANKCMHTVIEAYCTGCELCLPACPVDCIVMEKASGDATGWNAWSASQAGQARQRYQLSVARRTREKLENEVRLETKAAAALADPPARSQETDPSGLEGRKAVIQAALRNARTRRARPPGEA
ncbi:MAG: electron transport complex subunit RsxB [Burkholderiaceae bacterium]